MSEPRFHVKSAKMVYVGSETVVGDQLRWWVLEFRGSSIFGGCCFIFLEGVSSYISSLVTPKKETHTH